MSMTLTYVAAVLASLALGITFGKQIERKRLGRWPAEGDTVSFMVQGDRELIAVPDAVVRTVNRIGGASPFLSVVVKQANGKAWQVNLKLPAH